MEVDMNSVTGLPLFHNYFNTIGINPIFIGIIFIILLIYFILFKSLGNTSEGLVENNAKSEYSMFWILIISIFVVLLLINGFNHFFNINIITTIRNLFTSTPEIDIAVNNLNDNNKKGGHKSSVSNIIPEIKAYEEVYHIPGNKYNFNNARALCKAYSGRLANYKEIEEAYKDGGEWCSYGWSENQLALFPTQSKTWHKLQKVEGHENDCGRPGINGGFIDNPNVRFGVNCYGHKPKITPLEAKLLKQNQDFPITVRGQQFQNKIDYWKTQIEDILVAPFNRKNWSRR